MSVGAKHPRARRPRRHPAWWSSISRSVLDEPECSAMTNSPNRPSTKRGRPLVTDGRYRCHRCQRIANQRRAAWPGEDLCYSCVYTAMRTRGVESSCFSTRNSIVQPGEELDRLGNTRILLGREPISLPQPFAEPLKSPWSVSSAQVTLNLLSQPTRHVSRHRGSCAAFRSQIRSQRSKQQVRQPASHGGDAEASLSRQRRVTT